MSGKFIDAYAVLEIASDADDAAVRARHRELAKQFHPDRGGRAADGELMMRINRARDVLLDPVARATLDEELARRRRAAAPTGSAGKAPATASPGSTGAPPLIRDRRWRAEWGAPTPRPTPAPSSSPAPVPPPARVRPSAGRLRQATRQARAANPALSARQRPAAPKPPRTVTEPPPSQPAGQQTVNAQPAAQQPANPQPAPPQQKTAPSADKPVNAWSLYSVPLDAVSVASLLASVLMCGPIGFILGIIGLARTADDKRRGRWAAVAGIAISTLTMLVAIGYVMQAISAPSP
ncbi:DnaJ domain-containing protein [Nocardioides sp. NPDC059952]|uniref:DnaJ domain-containing protein n=1 Tax=Nocardioides sp. NPDC059952 TaxID=3347014 RepID=UPI00365E5AC5